MTITKTVTGKYLYEGVLLNWRGEETEARQTFRTKTDAEKWAAKIDRLNAEARAEIEIRRAARLATVRDYLARRAIREAAVPKQLELAF